jgi:hypothetical protein
VSGLTGKTLGQVAPNPAFNIKNRLSGLFYKYYEGNWDSLPDFTQLIPVKQGDVNNFSIASSPRKEFYSFQFEGMVLIPSTDVYAFYTASDDGSNLYIDDRLIVSNDGAHALTEAEGYIALAKGLHKIRVDYLQQTGGAELQVSIRGGILKKQQIPAWMLFR